MNTWQRKAHQAVQDLTLNKSRRNITAHASDPVVNHVTLNLRIASTNNPTFSVWAMLLSEVR